MPPPPKLEMPWGWSEPRRIPPGRSLGISYTSNLTPTRHNGLGIWTEDMFIRAMRTGKHMGTSRTILPPFRGPGTQRCATDELKAVFAY